MIPDPIFHVRWVPYRSRFQAKTFLSRCRANLSVFIDREMVFVDWILDEFRRDNRQGTLQRSRSNYFPTPFVHGPFHRGHTKKYWPHEDIGERNLDFASTIVYREHRLIEDSCIRAEPVAKVNLDHISHLPPISPRRCHFVRNSLPSRCPVHFVASSRKRVGYHDSQPASTQLTRQRARQRTLTSRKRR